jgi:hypothetical protein
MVVALGICCVVPPISVESKRMGNIGTYRDQQRCSVGKGAPGHVTGALETIHSGDTTDSKERDLNGRTARTLKLGHEKLKKFATVPVQLNHEL